MPPLIKANRPRKHYEGEPTGFFLRLLFHFRRKRKKNAARMGRRSLTFLNSQARNGLRVRLLMRYSRMIKSFGLALMSVRAYATASQSIARLSEPTTCIVVPPQSVGHVPNRHEGIFPAIEARLFTNVICASGCSALVTENQICVPELYTIQKAARISDGSFLFWHGQDGMGWVRQSEPEIHSSGLMMFGSGAGNWYHWLLEFLPTAFLAEGLPQEFAGDPLVIPAEIANLPSFRDSLEVFRNGREVRVLERGMHAFDRLIVIDPPVREPINMFPGNWPTARDYSYNPHVLLAYRDAIIERLGITVGPHHDRIFLARGHSRRSYNQDQLLDIAQRYGFRAVYPETLTFREQVETLANAAFVIGPSGAAFANTLFCQKYTRLLSWLIPQYQGFCSYANIAQTTGSTLQYLFVTPDQAIKSTHDGFQSGYHIDPEAFEAALRITVGDDDQSPG